MELSIDQTRAMLVAMCDAIIDNVDLLTKADQAIGDGDHGVGMRRGFKAAKQAVEAAEPGSVGDLFKAGGSAIIATSGGASGVIFGLFLRAPAKQLSGQTLDAAGYASWLAAAATQIQARGNAKPGDKTMVDAIVPAAEAAQAAVGQLGKASVLGAADEFDLPVGACLPAAGFAQQAVGPTAGLAIGEVEDVAAARQELQPVAGGGAVGAGQRPLPGAGRRRCGGAGGEEGEEGGEGGGAHGGSGGGKAPIRRLSPARGSP